MSSSKQLSGSANLHKLSPSPYTIITSHLDDGTNLPVGLLACGLAQPAFHPPYYSPRHTITFTSVSLLKVLLWTPVLVHGIISKFLETESLLIWQLLVCSHHCAHKPSLHSNHNWASVPGQSHPHLWATYTFLPSVRHALTFAHAHLSVLVSSHLVILPCLHGHS